MSLSSCFRGKIFNTWTPAVIVQDYNYDNGPFLFLSWTAHDVGSRWKPWDVSDCKSTWWHQAITWTNAAHVLKGHMELTHWGRVTHICVSKLTIIASDNGLSPGRRQAIIWTSAGILLIEPLGTNFNEILIEMHTFSFKKMHLKMSSGKWRPFCLNLNVLITTMS